MSITLSKPPYSISHPEPVRRVPKVVPITKPPTDYDSPYRFLGDGCTWCATFFSSRLGNGDGISHRRHDAGSEGRRPGSYPGSSRFDSEPCNQSGYEPDKLITSQPNAARSGRYCGQARRRLLLSIGSKYIAPIAGETQGDERRIGERSLVKPRHFLANSASTPPGGDSLLHAAGLGVGVDVRT